jgi:predicted acyltransferase
MSSHQRFRLQSLDTFRGITVAGMLLVNADGLSPSVHPWLAHTYWNGCSPADWIFPFFLFIIGVSMAFTFAKYTQTNRPTRSLYWRILKRSIVLFALGLCINVIGIHTLSQLRLTGVLQRISVAYLCAAIIVLNLPRKGQWGLSALMLLGYWVAYTNFPVPEPVMGVDSVAPEAIGTFGPMSWVNMMPTTVTVLLGYFCGGWLWSSSIQKQIQTSSQSLKLAMFGLSSIVLSQFWGIWLPINKKLWTSSYTLLTVGLALVLLAILYELMEVRGLKQWSHPLQVLGLNPIVVYVGSEVTIRLLETVHIRSGDQSLSSYLWLKQEFFHSHLNTMVAGVVFSFFMLFLWWIAAYALYRRRCFIAV